MDAFAAVSPAWARMKAILFAGRGAGLWFSFGFVFFLQSCVEGGGTGVGNYNSFGNSSSSRGGGHRGAGGFMDQFENAFGTHATGHFGPRDVSSEYGSASAASAVSTIVTIGIIAVIVAIPLLILASWLGARGRSMAIRAVAGSPLDVGVLWRTAASSAARIFKFQLLMLLIGVTMSVPLVGYLVFLLLPAFNSAHPAAAFNQLFENPAVLILIGSCTLLAYIPVAIVGSLFRNFVFPLSIRDDLPLGGAWGMFWDTAKHNLGGLFGFLFMRFVIAFAGGIVSMFAVCCTCFVGALPVLNQTLMAPFHVFERAHALYTLESMGPQFRIFGTAAFGGPPGGDSGQHGYPYGYPPDYGAGYPQGGFGPGPHDPNPYAPPAGGYGGAPAGGYGGPPTGGYGPPNG